MSNYNRMSQDWILRKWVKNKGCKTVVIFKSKVLKEKRKKKSSLSAKVCVVLSLSRRGISTSLFRSDDAAN
jgi:hypothetical protein